MPPAAAGSLRGVRRGWRRQGPAPQAGRHAEQAARHARAGAARLRPWLPAGSSVPRQRRAPLCRAGVAPRGPPTPHSRSQPAARHSPPRRLPAPAGGQALPPRPPPVPWGWPLRGRPPHPLPPEPSRGQARDTGAAPGQEVAFSTAARRVQRQQRPRRALSSLRHGLGPPPRPTGQEPPKQGASPSPSPTGHPIRGIAVSIQQPLPPPFLPPPPLPPPPQHRRSPDPPRSGGEGNEPGAAGRCPLRRRGVQAWRAAVRAAAACRGPGRAGAEPGSGWSGLSASGSRSNAGSAGQAAMLAPISSRASRGGAGPTAASSPRPANMEPRLRPSVPHTAARGAGQPSPPAQTPVQHTSMDPALLPAQPLSSLPVQQTSRDPVLPQYSPPAQSPRWGTSPRRAPQAACRAWKEERSR